MSNDVVGFQRIDRTQIALVGGKGAALGELSQIDGIAVPSGFCVTTSAFRRVVAHVPAILVLLDRLSRLDPGDRGAIRTLSAELRRTVASIAVPEDLEAAIIAELAVLGEHSAYAVRSSATAEDLPTASFAGQHDTFLNIVGAEAILRSVTRCWSSLFAERAVVYRLHHGVDDREVQMAVVVQRMVVPESSGVLFTADPVTSNRRVLSIEACFGLGEALVSGLVEADAYEVRDGEVVSSTIGTKQVVIEALPEGGTAESAVDPARRRRATLTHEQAVRLAGLGRRIEAHFGRPQDVEWCLVDEEFEIVQSRPITTLFPVPEVADGENHVYVSVGHGQMMTDAMKPLGLSMWRLTALPPMFEAGGRLFVDVTARLASSATSDGLVQVLGTSDPLLGDALRTVLAREDFLPSVPDVGPGAPPPVRGLPGSAPAPIRTDPALVTELVERREASLAALVAEIATKSGPELFEFIQEDIQELKRLVFEPESHQVLMAGMDAAGWLNERVGEWLGETNVADTLTRSVAGNVTSEMGLALLDVADVIRPHPAVVAFLGRVEREVGHDDFLEHLDELEGGAAARQAIQSFLDSYGMRCVGEIDITRPRWSEHPTALVPVILGNVRNLEPGAGERRVEEGREVARAKALEVLERLREMPDGERKAEEAGAMIDRVRTFAGYREYPKFVIVNRHFVYKQALMAEADRLVQAGVIGDREDVFFLSFQEMQEAVREKRVDEDLIRRRRDEFRSYEALTPPRVITSDGEAITGVYRRDDVPEGALVGLGVSAGTVEGRARVIHDMGQADVEPGDILVTAFTDPSWSPLFVSIAGLVTEVGGLMTHGAVIAREYGLSAVVGVERATRLIRDGQRIRVHGTEGYVEILDP